MGKAGEREYFCIDDYENTFGSGENSAVWELKFGLVKELAAFAVEVSADKDERLEERRGAEVVHLHVTGHGDDVEGTVELAHGFVEKGGDDAAVDVAGWAFVEAI